MKKIILFYMLIFPFTLAAQQLKGTVTDKAGHPLDVVTIILNQLPKNSTFALADSGHFTLGPVAPGQYTLSATLTGYHALTRIITMPKDTVLLIMQPDNKQLKEVTISAARPVIERKIDRVTFNVENSIVASGGSAWDALSKAPGVQARPDNSLTANHKAVELYVDGKPLHLSGDDLTSYLKGLPGDVVSQIEVFSNPPAQFEAQGASVINIVTKKSKKQGFNAALNGNLIQATYGSYTAGTTFNYRKDKLNIYGSYGYTHKRNTVDHDIYVDYGASYWESPNHIVYNSNSHNYRLGADYQLSNNQIIGFLITGNNRSGNSERYTPTRVTSSNRSVLDSTLQTNTRAANSGSLYAYNLNYNLKSDSGRNSLNIDVDYSPFQSQNNSYIDNLSFLSDGNLAGNPFHIYTPVSQQIDIYSGKADYNYRIGKIWNMATGLKYSSVNSKNSFDFFNNQAGILEAVPSNNNHFNYQENTAAAYTSLSGAISRLTLQAGLRAEYTATRGYSITLDSLNKRHYFKLFPTLFLQYKFNDDNEILFNYAYRIDRPEYNRLNPAKHYSSPYSFYVGNPGLQPAFVQNLELGYTYQKKYNITAYYTATHGMFSNITNQDNVTKQYFDTQVNLGLSVNTGLRFSAPFQPTSWWEINLMAEGYYQQEKATYLQGSYDYHILSYDATLNQSFTINQAVGLKAELIGIYNAPGIQGIYRAGVNREVDAGVKANILKGQGTIKLSANDIFNTNYYNIKINYLNQNNGFFYRADTRNVTASFTYRFGKNIAASRTRSTASEEEKKRAQ